MAGLYPHIEPYDSGMLEVGDAHRVYWETCGNPSGKPAVVLHGGPGSGCTPGWRRYFNPDRYRIVLFDQRGSGRSTPHASEPGIDLSTNTTHHLLADIELLRRHLGLERWLVLGGSWGTTLALAYAQRHPNRVTEMVLESIATTTSQEVDWITRGIGAFFPDAWERFRSGAPEADRSGSLVDAYNRLLMNPDPAIHAKAARDWCDWENAIVALHANAAPNPRYQQPAFRLGFARLVTHYWRHHAWLEDGSLLREASFGHSGNPDPRPPGLPEPARDGVAACPAMAWQRARGRRPGRPRHWRSGHERADRRGHRPFREPLVTSR